jgi:hypothetical protein
MIENNGQLLDLRKCWDDLILGKLWVISCFEKCILVFNELPQYLFN